MHETGIDAVAKLSPPSPEWLTASLAACTLCRGVGALEHKSEARELFEGS